MPSTFALTTALLIFQVFVTDYVAFLPPSLLPLWSFCLSFIPGEGTATIVVLQSWARLSKTVHDSTG